MFTELEIAMADQGLAPRATGRRPRRGPQSAPLYAKGEVNRRAGPHGPAAPVILEEREELCAQRIACDQLIKGCERSLFNFGLAASYATGHLEDRINRRTAWILGEILQSWRETRGVLEIAGVAEVGQADVAQQQWLQMALILGQRTSPVVRASAPR